MHTATVLHCHTFVPVKEVATVALAAFETFSCAPARRGQAGAGEITSPCAQLIMAVGWAGES